MAKARPKAKAKSAAKAKASPRRKAPARTRRVEAIPKAYGAVTPFLVVRGGNAAIDFYVRAFGAKERSRMPGPGGKVMHAELKFGDRMLMLADEFPEMGSKSPQTLGGSGSSLLLYVKDTDAAYRRALEAGAQSIQAPEDQFWGDRYARIADPFGHLWQLATHVEDVTPKEMKRRMEALPAPGQG
jgi:PhnB protein